MYHRREDRQVKKLVKQAQEETENLRGFLDRINLFKTHFLRPGFPRKEVWSQEEFRENWSEPCA